MVIYHPLPPQMWDSTPWRPWLPAEVIKIWFQEEKYIVFDLNVRQKVNAVFVVSWTASFIRTSLYHYACRLNLARIYVGVKRDDVRFVLVKKVVLSFCEAEVVTVSLWCIATACNDLKMADVRGIVVTSWEALLVWTAFCGQMPALLLALDSCLVPEEKEPNLEVPCHLPGSCSGHSQSCSLFSR